MTTLELLAVNLMTERALTQAEDTLHLTAKNSPYYAEYEAAAKAARERWEAEAPARAYRARVTRAGFRRSDYEPGIWIRKDRLGKWIKYTPDQVVEAVGG